MLKYSLPFAGRLRPFLAAGPSFRSQENASATEPSRLGVSAGAGAAFHLGRIRIAPTLRYTRWARESIYPRYATKCRTSSRFSYQPGLSDGFGLAGFAGRKLEFGAVAGLPVTRGFQPAAQDATIVERTRYLAGPTLQMNVAGNFSLEADAIFKPRSSRQPHPERAVAILGADVAVSRPREVWLGQVRVDAVCGGGSILPPGGQSQWLQSLPLRRHCRGWHGDAHPWYSAISRAALYALGQRRTYPFTALRGRGSTIRGPTPMQSNSSSVFRSKLHDGYRGNESPPAPPPHASSCGRLSIGLLACALEQRRYQRRAG